MVEDTCHARCKEMLEKARLTAKVGILEKAMDDLGCKLPESFFKCSTCEPNEAIIGGFVTDAEKDRQVVVCEDNVAKFHVSQSHVDKTVAHELIHAYDHCRANIDWSNCLHIACAEVRAANLSGDCHMTSEIDRMNLGIRGQGAKCVRRRALLSVQAHPECTAIAKQALEQVFDGCYKDRSPFISKMDY